MELIESEDTPRKMVENALKKIRESPDPDERLSNIWKISQLIEDTTDEELFELAAEVAVEDDPRLRGEICYTISRSRRPNLIKIVENMALDKDQYVRREALSAISEFFNVIDAVSNTAKLINDSQLRELLDQALHEKKAVNNYQNDKIVLDNRMKCWETYLRNEKELLKDHNGEYIAIYKGDIIGIDKSDLTLAKMLYDRYGADEALILKIIEDNKEPIEIPTYVGNIVEQ